MLHFHQQESFDKDCDLSPKKLTQKRWNIPVTWIVANPAPRLPTPQVPRQDACGHRTPLPTDRQGLQGLGDPLDPFAGRGREGYNLQHLATKVQNTGTLVRLSVSLPKWLHDSTTHPVWAQSHQWRQICGMQLGSQGSEVSFWGGWMKHFNHEKQCRGGDSQRNRTKHCRHFYLYTVPASFFPHYNAKFHQ